MTDERQAATAGVGPGRPAEPKEDDLRKQAADALRPFARAWADLQGAPEQYRRPGYALLNVGPATVTSTHLRLAAEALAALEAPSEQG